MVESSESEMKCIEQDESLSISLYEIQNINLFELTSEYIKYLENIGDSLSVYNSFKYLSDKYSNLCTVLLDSEGDREKWITLTYRYDGDLQKFVIDFPDKISSEIIKCFLQTSRFIAIPLLLMQPIRGAEYNSHSNILIYDTKKKELERFEPHGDIYTRENIRPIIKKMYKNIDDDILKFLNKYEKNVKKYYKPIDYCPEMSFQTLEVLENESLPIDPGGYCSMWCIWYLDLRLSNPNKSRKTIVNFAISKIEKDGFKNFIRDYSLFIKQEILKQREDDILKYFFM